jgi:hypothetical protein
VKIAPFGWRPAARVRSRRRKRVTARGARRALTWKLLFGSIGQTQGLAHNFYSEEEDVVRDADDNTSASIVTTLLHQGFDVSTGAWKAQELVKGVHWKTSLASVFMMRGQAGWGFNTAWDVLDASSDPFGDPVLRRRTPAETAAITNEQLKIKPFFEDFLEPELTSATAVTASAKAAKAMVRYDLFARGFPAMSNVAPASAQPRGFKGLASEMITVWRKLNVEQDTLAAVAVIGPESNLEGGRIDRITDLGGGRFRLNLDIDLPGGQNRFQNGTLNIEGQEFAVESNDNNLFTGDDLIVKDNARGALATWLASSTTGLAFILEDDDGQYLPSHAVLPLAASERFITPYVLEKYAPAYIEPDDSQPNPNPVISFKLNLEPPHPGARDLTDRPDFWAVRLVAAFQPTVPDDCDPNTESFLTGEYWGADACVFWNLSVRITETLFPFRPAQFGNNQYLKDRGANVAHEIGHGPNPGDENNGDDDHDEGGLMAAGIGDGAGAPFTSASIRRFRSALKWSD